jgi:hypothetical protein
VQISPDVEGVGKPLKPEHGETTEVEAVIVKDVSVAAVGREEARPAFATDDELRLRREGSIASQVATDTPSAAWLCWWSNPRGYLLVHWGTFVSAGREMAGQPFHYSSWLDPSACHGGG